MILTELKPRIQVPHRRKLALVNAHHCWKVLCGLLLALTAITGSLEAQSYTVLHSFDWTDGADPYGGLVQGLNGNLYGTSTYGGDAGNCEFACAGTLFEVTPGGEFTLLYDFCSLADCADGNYPYGTLLQASNGKIYGTTNAGGAYGGGTAFEVTPTGALTTIYSFCAKANCADGASPTAGLIEGADHSLYGTTFGGGRYGGGTVFKITRDGHLITLHSFCALANCADGEWPYAGLVLGTDGNLYGTTELGGTVDATFCSAGCGTAFKITPSGAFTTLYFFCTQANCLDGRGPSGGLVQASDGNFYGTTFAGGTGASCGTSGCGTAFRLRTTGVLTTIHIFASAIAQTAFRLRPG